MAVTRVALITGANRGIGLEIAGQLARSGYLIALGCRDEASGLEAQKHLAREGLDAAVVPLDVTYATSVAAAMKLVDDLFGRLDVLVNNAGVLLDSERGGPKTSVRDVPIDVVKATFDVNVLGALRLTQAALPRMEANHYGRVVNLSSGLGQLADMQGGMPAYRMSKAALNALTRITAAEVAADRIKVNAAIPGWVRTRMGGPDADLTVAQGADTAVWLATLPEDGPTGGLFKDRSPVAW
ncbi:MAG: SDR family oxidoreductase [Hyphomicrobiaceae bacterium]